LNMDAIIPFDTCARSVRNSDCQEDNQCSHLLKWYVHNCIVP
jgi:hypothetical protein